TDGRMSVEDPIHPRPQLRLVEPHVNTMTGVLPNGTSARFLDVGFLACRRHGRAPWPCPTIPTASRLGGQTPRSQPKVARNRVVGPQPGGTFVGTVPHSLIEARV